MIKDIERVKDKVEYLLQEYPHTRDSDKSLWLGYLKVFHEADKKLQMAEDPWGALIRLIHSPECCTMESVRRVRQKFQEQGMYLGTKRQERVTEAEAMRDYVKEML